MINMFGSRQEAQAVAKKLARHFPGNNYDVWPDGRGFWVLVVRYLDGEGHIRFRFVANEPPEERERRVSKRAVAGEETANAPRYSRQRRQNAPHQLRPS